MTDTATKDVQIVNEQGMHARPIAMMVSAAQKFRSKLFVSCEGREVDGKSVIQLMMISAPKGATLSLRAEGPDATDLVAAVAAVVSGGFGEM